MKTKISSIIRFVLFLMLIAFAVYSFRYSKLEYELNVDNIKNFVQGFGFVSFLIFVLVYAVGTLVSIPGVILTFVGAILFGVILGTVLNVMGAAIGASAAFFAAKLLGRDFVQGLLKGKLEGLNQKIEKNAFNGILILRLIPAVPFIGINYGCGLLKVRFRDYFFATLIGIIPGAFVYTYLFATVGERALMGELSAADFLTPQILIPIVLFIILLLIPILYKRVKKIIKKSA